MSNIWQLQDAKSKFSDLVERARSQGVQIVTRRGVKTVAILPYDEYLRLSRQSDSLAQFLLASPLRGSQIEIERAQDLPRKIEIEP